MLWLLACTAPPPPSPSITLPISPPPALYATAVSATEFVGPLDVTGLEPAVLCEGRDRAALLRSGRFGWRVLVLGPDGVQPFDVVIPPGAPPKTASGMTAERMNAWAAADSLVAARCDRAPSTPVLLAVDGASQFDATALIGLHGLDLQLLVMDSVPRPPVRTPTKRTKDAFLTFVASNEGWSVLTSNRDAIAPLSHTSLSEAVGRVTYSGYPHVVLMGDPEIGWSRMVEGLDALARVGVVPRLGLKVGGAAETPPPPAPAPGPMGTTEITLAHTLPVLGLQAATSAQEGFRPNGFAPLLIMMGAEGEPSVADQE